jgi:hypothetical protein
MVDRSEDAMTTTDGTSVPIAKAKGRPMLQWVGNCCRGLLIVATATEWCALQTCSPKMRW